MDMPKDKIALFLPSLRGGGAERAMFNLAKGFAERGLNVDLILSKAEGTYITQIPKNIQVIDFKTNRVMLSIPPLALYLHRERPKVLLSAMMHANIAALIARKLANVDTHIIISERTTIKISSSNANTLRGRYLYLLAKRVYPYAEKIVAVSKGVADDLSSTLNIPIGKIKVIYNPVITKEFLEKSNEPVNHSWFRNNKVPVVLAAGRLTKAKDFPTLIHAFALVQKEVSARLMILGEGEERRNLEKLIKKLKLEKNVELPGFVDNPYKYMKHAAVFVLSSKWEGLPNVLIEALVCGTPVVSTDCSSGPAEILQNGKFGKLVPVGDAKAMADAIKESINKNIYKPLSFTSYDTYTLPTIIEKYLKIFREL